MHYILLLGALFNFAGALKLIYSVLRDRRQDLAAHHQEWSLFKLFTAGIAVTYGSLYLYLFYHEQFAIPFLIFGAIGKTWALLAALYLYARRRLGIALLIEFGLSNGFVGLLFWFYIISAMH